MRAWGQMREMGTVTKMEPNSAAQLPASWALRVPRDS